ncbi:arylsulfatase I [Aplysia californica]|uniref:Arylsulfatase I n=1 Tax=Aplysia californica TaxID=6500 RepID=A0ABM0JTQ7_APLCA|nr:arylsulfatase I [Aplysia californica]
MLAHQGCTIAARLSLLYLLLCRTVYSIPPNIVFILADDLGWDDVGFHGSEILTPNIDKLAQAGVVLNNYYVQPICTPTRGSILSGRYPIHTGLQHSVITGSQPYGLPLKEVTIAQRLKELGYDTHGVGKWHLGFFKDSYLPENRGFDSHYGYYLGHGDFFDHYAGDGGHIGYDFHFNGQTTWNLSEVYSTEIFTQRAETVIHQHNQSKPLFLYLAHQAVHAGNAGDPIQVPQKYVDRFPYIKNMKRRLFAGVTSALDDSVGAVYKALQDAGMADNTVIVFSTDNGGPANNYDGNAACNWPLRGTKNTLWQGGVRGVGFVNSPLLKKSGYVNENLMHVVDWLPTIYTLAGGNVSMLGDIDGVDQSAVISRNSTSTRKEVLLNIDPIYKHEAIIVGDFKYIYGYISRNDNEWYPPPGSTRDVEKVPAGNELSVDFNNLQQWQQLYNDDNSIKTVSDEGLPEIISQMDASYELWRKQRLQETSSTLTFDPQLVPSSHKGQEQEDEYKNTVGDMHMRVDDERLLEPIKVKCGLKPANASTNCDPVKKACLYNLRDDPCEFENLALALPDVVERLEARVAMYRKTMIPPGNKPIDPRGNPQLHGGVWVPWL